MARAKKEKCITCHHPLSEHTDEHCLHWHWDIRKRCKCQEGSEGVTLDKEFAGVKVFEVIEAGNSFVWFRDYKGNQYRWMYAYKQLWPVDM